MTDTDLFVACGTRAGFTEHLLRDEEPCADCEYAEKRYREARREAFARPGRRVGAA